MKKKLKENLNLREVMRKMAARGVIVSPKIVRDVLCGAELCSARRQAIYITIMNEDCSERRRGGKPRKHNILGKSVTYRELAALFRRNGIGFWTVTCGRKLRGELEWTLEEKAVLIREYQDA